MMKQVRSITIIFFCIQATCIAQTTQFKGQLLQNNVVVKNYTVLIDGKPATTDDAGVFYIPINASAALVTILPVDQKYVIVYPVAGRTPVPKDAGVVTQIIVASFTSNNYLKRYLDVSKKIQDSVGKSRAEIKLLQQQLDTIVQALHKLSYTDSDLRSAKEIQDGKDRNIYDITTDLANFSRNAQNLISAFKYVADYAFTNSNALQQLSEAVTDYNEVYNRLDGKKVFYQQAINNYWSKDEADSFRQVIAYALDTLHTSNIYPLRDLLQQIRDYFNGGKKSNDLKASIQKKISDILTTDQEIIDELKNKTTRFTQSLIT